MTASYPTASAFTPVGRFAPSPTGLLHFGSLVAALGSWLDARAAGGRWLVRIEDVDTPRIVPGADQAILSDLESFGLHWDGEVLWQSQRTGRYRAALEALRAEGLIYPCHCSRKQITAASQRRARDGGLRYAGTCRNAPYVAEGGCAQRVRTHAGLICFDDALQGRQCEDIEREVGDFVLLRADGVWAYQLAVVVDDAEQGVTDIVRGADLLDSTPRQIFLQRLLGYPEPRYLHLPVACNAAGEKLSKQTLARAVAALAPSDALGLALEFLGHAPPAALRGAPVPELLDWARGAWRRDRLPAARAASAPPGV
ncbi:tRNA glutamyl-Q(34) synthetase GluQRS [Niveibacterium sp. 24ML]|nr:tRNA glutamyl-Q(34) synthetase GluQRS [Niveibacterium sp. 24ML]MCX9155574.1 tRNA glutamyl-Q(34) synthetase GluQRS [Niveibacterium sp. 24ML]